MDTTRASLIDRIRDFGDVQAWGEFDSLYRPILYRFARLQGLDAFEAEEVVQLCMTTVAQEIEHFRYDPCKGRFRGWLKTMVIHRIRRLMRDRRRAMLGEEAMAAICGQDPSPEDLFERLWLQEHLRRCLETLRLGVDQASFDAFCRHVFDGWTVQEVCQATGLRSQQFHRLKWRLGHALADMMREATGAG
ncbi:MAG: hypothetical protein AMXMBFR13_04110 [Phycisphaerae bacterium]